jgi:hypothetical protein
MTNSQFKLRHLVAACCAAALSVALVPSTCAAAPDTLTPQARADFEWFGTLGFPDLKGCPYVRVATDNWSQYNGEPPQQTFTYGFLLATNAAGFTVCYPYLSEETFKRPNPVSETPAAASGFPMVPGFQIVGLSNGVLHLLEVLRNPKPSDDKRELFGRLPYDALDVFTLAWACWRNGLDAQAAQLYEQAGKTGFRSGQDVTTTNFSLALEKDLGDVMYARAVYDFERTAIPRPQLLAQFQSVVTNYPHSQDLERAKQFMVALKRMVSEDEAHAKNAPTNLAQLPVEQQVRELIFRLRDQIGGRIGIPDGPFEIFMDNWGGTNTPAGQLLTLGYAAVPQLIAALDDPTFCRMVEGGLIDFRQTEPAEPIVLTVGDCAEAILERIAGRGFYPRRDVFSHFSKEGDLPATRKAIESWWAVAKQKGEKQILIEEFASPNPNLEFVDNLCRHFPEIAAATLIRAALAATNSENRYQLVYAIAKLDDPQAADFLSRDMVSAPSCTERVTAAYGLRDRRKDEALQAMIHLWDDSLGKSDGEGSGMLQDFLADSDSVPAIQAFQRNLRQRPISIRWNIMCDIGETNAWQLGGRHKYSPATLDAIEECLVSELDDTEELAGFKQWYPPGIAGTNSKPRLCDFAGFYLTERRPDRYMFDCSVGLDTRDRQRVECQNVWRLAHNLPALPLPPTPSQPKSPENP